MWRFVLEENIRRIHALIAEPGFARELETLRQLLQEAEAGLRRVEHEWTVGSASHELALKAFAERTVDDALERHGADFVTLQIYDEASETVAVLAQRNFRAPFLHHLSSVTPGDGSALGECIAHDTPIAIEDVNRAAAYKSHWEAAREAGFQAVHYAPVRNQSGNLMAVLSTYFTTPQRFSEDGLNRMMHYAYSIGMYLQTRL